MKFPRPFWGPFCCLILIMDSLCSNDGLRSVLDGYSAGRASFIENRYHYLSIQPIRSISAHDPMQCALNCLVTVKCRSFNFRLQEDLNGKHVCELLASDKFIDSKHFVPNTEYHHYSIVTPCDYAPCQYGYKCLPLYEIHDFVCDCSPGNICDMKVPLWLKVNTKEVCFGARDDSYGAFALRYSGDIVSFKLVHLSGSVSCGSSRSSYWGCSKSDRRLRTFLTDESNAVVFPQGLATDRYTIPGVRSDSTELTFNNLSAPLRVAGGQEFRVWYDEDLNDESESDNQGKTCMDIYALYV